MTTLAMTVIKAEQHPNADALRLYQFSVPGREDTLQIVANLENVYEIGDVAVVVLADATLKDGTKIKACKLRGVPSYGMALGKTDSAAGTDLTDQYEQPTVLRRGVNVIKWTEIESLYNVRRALKQMGKENLQIPYWGKVKLDGCLYRRTKITMWDSSKKTITKIVPGDYVLGMNKNNEIVKTKVLNVFNNGTSNEWVEVRGHRGFHEKEKTSAIFSIKCTPNHLFWCKSQNKYIEAQNLTLNDIVLYNRRPELKLSFVHEQVLLGKMLGDGSINNLDNSASICWGHTEKYKEYVSWTLKAVGGLGNPQIKKYESGYGSIMYRAATVNSFYIKDKFECFISSTTQKKIVPDWVADELHPLAIAFWYMDDGSLSHDHRQRDRAVFHTNNFTEKDCQVLLRGLHKFGICGSITNAGKSKDKTYPTICIDTESSEKLFALIMPYILPCMQYKLPTHYRGYPGFLPQIDSFYNASVMERKIISVTKCSDREKKHDLETETHNYFANGVLVHNSNGGIQLFSDGRIVPQSRTRIIDPEDDNIGFARWVVANYDYFAQVRNRANELGRTDHLTIFGEWCGQGIQKRTAISKIDRKIFAIFAVQFGGLDTPAKLDVNGHSIEKLLPPHNDVFVLPWFNEVFLMDFSDKEQLERQADQINKLVLEVEEQDPWVASTFDKKGIGEGVVLYPIIDHVYRGWDGPIMIDKMDFSDLVFKAKGEKHKVVNTKQAVQVDPEVAKNVDEFVTLFVTEPRLEQFADAVGIDNQKTGEFLKKFCSDVQKESVAELEASGLDWKQVGKAVGNAARKWYLEKCTI